MKKLLLILFLIPSLANSQSKYFELQPTGISIAKSPTDDHIVIDVPEQSQKEIFNKVLLYVNTHFVSPKDVISKIEYNSITLNSLYGDAIRGRMLTRFDLNFTINFQFKDGKMRIGLPSINSMNGLNGGEYQTMNLVGGISITGNEQRIFNKKGKLKGKKAKKDIEDAFNNLVSGVVSSLTKKNSDW